MDTRSFNANVQVASRAASDGPAKARSAKGDAAPFAAELNRANADAEIEAGARSERRQIDRADRAVSVLEPALELGETRSVPATVSVDVTGSAVEEAISAEGGTQSTADAEGQAAPVLAGLTPTMQAQDGADRGAPSDAAVPLKTPEAVAGSIRVPTDVKGANADPDTPSRQAAQPRLPEAVALAANAPANAKSAVETNAHQATTVVPALDRLVLGPMPGQTQSSRAQLLSTTATAGDRAGHEAPMAGVIARITDQRAYFPPVMAGQNVSGGRADTPRFEREADRLDLLAPRVRDVEGFGDAKREFAVSLADDLATSARLASPTAQPATVQASARILAELAQLQSEAARATAAQDLASSESPEILRTLSLELQPKSLGTIRVDIALRGAELVVQLKPELDTVAQQLESDRATLSKLLLASGYDLKDLVIETVLPATQPDGSPRTDTDPMRQDARGFEEPRSQKQVFEQADDHNTGHRAQPREAGDRAAPTQLDAIGDASSKPSVGRIVV